MKTFITKWPMLNIFCWLAFATLSVCILSDKQEIHLSLLADSRVGWVGFRTIILVATLCVLLNFRISFLNKSKRIAEDVTSMADLIDIVGFFLPFIIIALFIGYCAISSFIYWTPVIPSVDVIVSLLFIISFSPTVVCCFMTITD